MTRTDRRNAGSLPAPISTPDRSPPAISASSSSTPAPPGPRETVPPPPVPLRSPRSRPPPTPTPAPDPTFFDDVVEVVADKYGWDLDAEVRVWPLDAEDALVGVVQRYEFRARAGGVTVALARVSDWAVDWSRLDAPVVEEVVELDGVEFAAGDDTLRFGSGIKGPGHGRAGRAGGLRWRWTGPRRAPVAVGVQSPVCLSTIGSRKEKPFYGRGATGFSLKLIPSIYYFLQYTPCLFGQCLEGCHFAFVLFKANLFTLLFSTT